ncbi:MAG TPA: T9SS type A sorting domain-containing protein [Saprospiraceae bacterium]|nr:T9SS type A sorting domain-containing protein [Saprospiraceae bacterium]HMQ82932.1 T9SS type A sorting domain-containing protein [Saprospiraceae bacterium]
MKFIITFLFWVAINLLLNGQCSTVSVQVSSSDTSYVQLYHAGFFLIPSGFANSCEWEVTTFSGEIIYQDTTSGGAFEQGLVLFDHSVPITDSMKVTIVITNQIEGIICTMSDTLYWNETEVLPGSFIGDWEVLSSNFGVEEQINASEETVSGLKKVALFPSPVQHFFQLKGSQGINTLVILDVNGQVLLSYPNIQDGDQVDASGIPPGMYFVQLWDKNTSNLVVMKMIKI